MISFLKKPADKSELLAAIEYFKPINLTVLLFEGNNRISEKEVRSWKGTEKLNLKFKNFDSKVFSQYILFNEIAKIKDCKYVCLPVGNHRAFYKVMPKLKAAGYTTIHISDGVNDSFSLIGFLLSVKLRGVLGFFKSFYSYFEYKKALADYCFFQLFPLKSCLSKKTLPCKSEVRNNFELEKELTDNNIDTLILPGWGETDVSLVSFFNVKNNYCATSKDKKININGRWNTIDNFISAEDVIRSGKIKYVYGTASSACYFVKNYDSSIECHVYVNGELNKTQGLFSEFFFVKKGKQLGVKFYKK